MWVAWSLALTHDVGGRAIAHVVSSLEEIALLEEEAVSPHETESMLAAARRYMEITGAESDYAELTENDVQLLLGKQT